MVLGSTLNWILNLVTAGSAFLIVIVMCMELTQIALVAINTPEEIPGPCVLADRIDGDAGCRIKGLLYLRMCNMSVTA